MKIGKVLPYVIADLDQVYVEVRRDLYMRSGDETEILYKGPPMYVPICVSDLKLGRISAEDGKPILYAEPIEFEGAD